MKVLSVFGYTPQVIKRLEMFLSENRFSNIHIDPLTNEITAERKFLFFWKDYIHLHVISSKDNVANIELKLNPLHEPKTSGDDSKELALQNRIYFYF